MKWTPETDRKLLILGLGKVLSGKDFERISKYDKFFPGKLDSYF